MVLFVGYMFLREWFIILKIHPAIHSFVFKGSFIHFHSLKDHIVNDFPSKIYFISFIEIYLNFLFLVIVI